jgi:hypothetical protein
MGACNCGHLAQTVTELPREALHAMATERPGDWSELARDHCGASGLPIDHVIATMLAIGLSRSDIRELERLEGREILRRLPAGERTLDHRRKADVVRYLETWADLLEEAHAGSEAARREAEVVATLAAAGQARAVEEAVG